MRRRDRALRYRLHRSLALELALASLAACHGVIGDTSTPEEGERRLAIPPAFTSVARRLTASEYDAAIRDLVGDASAPASATLPEDGGSPFDNDYTKQVASAALIDGAHQLALDVAHRFARDPARRDAVLPCVPTGPGDGACLRQFIVSFGRRALRRPLAEDEVERYAALQRFATEPYTYVETDFFTAVELVVAALLQDLEFLYRVEVGAPVDDMPGVHALDDFEVGARLAFFLWGTIPDEALLDAAAAGSLREPAGRRAAATRMLDDPRARRQIERFHAQWLGYERLAHGPELTAAMRAETAALIERVVFGEPRSYFELFTATETFVDATLAEHYGLASLPASQTWVSYGDTGRRGVLSHGTVLSAFAKFDDTSPTQRGIFIRTRLMCEVIPPPPPNVNADEPPSASTGDCKVERYAQHRSGACAGCHEQTDPIGFGLEKFDRAGRYREHDEGRPECHIEGAGELRGIGTFRGPAELAQLLVDSGHLEGCVVRQLFRFASGRRERVAELPYVEELRGRFAAGGHDLRALIVELVGTDQFARRYEE